MKNRKPVWIIFAVVVVSWLAIGFFKTYKPVGYRLQGQVEARQYSVSSKVPGRIGEVLVRKGDRVEPGQLIFTIFSPELDAKLEQARAGRDAAGAMSDMAEKGARSQEIAAARDQWQTAGAAAELMEKTYRRVNNLFEEGVVSEQKRDEVYTQWRAAKFTENAAEQLYLMAKEGAREETKRAAADQVRMAEGVVKEVEAFEADTRIESSYKGEVAQVLLHEGELAPIGFPVVTVVDMQDAWVVLNIREDRLQDFNKGTRFQGVIPALGGSTHEFIVDHMAVMGDFATWRATDTGKGFDMRTFEIEARPVNEIKDLRVGMSVLVEN